MRKTSLLSIILMLSGGLSGLLGAYALQGGSHPVTFPDVKTDTQLLGHLYRPEGPGPFPAVVFLHGCAGIRPKHHWWAQKLQRWGYVVLIVDSFGPRNITNICVDAQSDDEAQRDDETQSVTPYFRTFDAHGGLRYLQRQPYVEAHRIGLMGWSHGGGTVLTALHRLAVEVAGVPRSNFRAAVAWYPFCLGDAFTTPLLILIGEKDDWTPARACVQLMKDLQTDSAPVTLKVYPGAYHSFDRLPSERITYKGHTLERHPPAAALAEAEIKRFLALHLTAQPQTR